MIGIDKNDFDALDYSRLVQRKHSHYPRLEFDFQVDQVGRHLAAIKWFVQPFPQSAIVIVMIVAKKVRRHSRYVAIRESINGETGARYPFVKRAFS